MLAKNRYILVRTFIFCCYLFTATSFASKVEWKRKSFFTTHFPLLFSSPLHILRIVTALWIFSLSLLSSSAAIGARCSHFIIVACAYMQFRFKLTLGFIILVKCTCSPLSINIYIFERDFTFKMGSHIKFHLIFL